MCSQHVRASGNSAGCWLDGELPQAAFALSRGCSKSQVWHTEGKTQLEPNVPAASVVEQHRPTGRSVPQPLQMAGVSEPESRRSFSENGARIQENKSTHIRTTSRIDSENCKTASNLAPAASTAVADAAAAAAAATAAKRYQLKRPRIVAVESPQDSLWRAQPLEISTGPRSSKHLVFFSSGCAWSLSLAAVR